MVEFFNFIVERVKDEFKSDVKALMKDNFEKQVNGTFTRDTMIETQSTLMKMLKPEAIEEVKTAMAHFASQMK